MTEPQKDNASTSTGQVRFTVLVPTYNHARYLPAALDSLLTQTYPHWEAVVVNDGSTDQTAAILTDYAARDARIRPIHKENGGTVSALNTALENAQGEWICWLSSDDLFEPRKLQRHQEAIAAHPEFGFFYSGFYYLMEASGEKVAPDYVPPADALRLLSFFEANYINGLSVCVRRDIFQEAGPFDNRYRYAHDVEMWFRILARHSGHYIPERLSVSRVHPAQVTENFPQAGHYDIARFTLEFLNQHALDALFPSLDISRSEHFLTVLPALITLLLKPQAAFYATGYSSALVERLHDWLYGVMAGQLDGGVYQQLQRIVASAREHPGLPAEISRDLPLLLDHRATPLAHQHDYWEEFLQHLVQVRQGGPADYARALERYYTMNRGPLPEELAAPPAPMALPLESPAAGPAAPGSGAETGDFVNICVITYNRIEFTRQCLDALTRHTDFPHRITVVDNGSSDGTIPYLQTLQAEGRVHNLILFARNVGVARAANAGWAAEPGARWYVKLDNDMVMQGPWLAAMVDVAEAIPQAGAIGYNVEPQSFPASTLQGRRVRVKPRLNLGGACLMVPRRVHEKLGYWCEDYGLYGEEDADYCFRVLIAGLLNMYMDDENLAFHLPGGKAAIVDPVTFEARDGAEEHLYADYRRWKDALRKQNASDQGILHARLQGYNTGSIPLCMPSPFVDQWLRARRATYQADIEVDLRRGGQAAPAQPLASGPVAAPASAPTSPLTTSSTSTSPAAPPAPLEGDMPLATPEQAEAYRRWIDNRMPREIDGQILAEHVHTWGQPPSFHFLVVLERRGEEEGLSLTLDSLGNQWFGTWRLSVVAPFPCPDPLFQELPMLTWVDQGDTSPEARLAALNRAVADSPQARETEWLALIPSGGRFDPSCLIKCADTIHRHPAWQLVYTDADLMDRLERRSNPRFKPDCNPDMLRATYYLGNLCLFARRALSEGDSPWQVAGAEAHDLALRLLDLYGPGALGHLPEVLFHDRFDPPPAPAPFAPGATALARHLARQGIDATVSPGLVAGSYRLSYHFGEQPLVTLVIPNKDKLSFLKACLESVERLTDYPHYEVLIVDNQSSDPALLAYYATLEARQERSFRVVYYPHPFNYSAICNLGAREARGDYLLFLNNDTQALHEDWLSVMMSHAQRPDIGAVGARLVFPDSGKVQHIGVVLGLGGTASHPFMGHLGLDEPGYMNRAHLDQNYSAVTGACQLIRRDRFLELGGLDEERFKVCYNDVDICLRLADAGYRILWTPYATLAHHESITRNDTDRTTDPVVDLRNRERFTREQDAMVARWLPRICRDPAYNRNLTLLCEDMRAEWEIPFTWDPEFHDRPRILALVPPGLHHQYRGDSPIRALGAANRLQYQVGAYPLRRERALYASELARLAPDVLLLQNPFAEHYLPILDQCGQVLPDIHRVLSLQDPILLLQENNPQISDLYRAFDDVPALVSKVAAHYHRLILPTQAWADLFAEAHCEVRVVPHYLPRQPWAQLTTRRNAGARPRVGWLVFPHQQRDFALLRPVMETLAEEVEWVSLGQLPFSHRKARVEAHPLSLQDDYPALLAALNLDAALVPLADHPYSRCLGNLRLLELGALGIPIIASDVPAHREGDLPVTRVDNQPQAWIEALRPLLANPDLRASQGQALKNRVWADFALEDHLDEWLDALLPARN